MSPVQGVIPGVTHQPERCGVGRVRLKPATLSSAELDNDDIQPGAR